LARRSLREGGSIENSFPAVHGILSFCLALSKNLTQKLFCQKRKCGVNQKTWKKNALKSAVATCHWREVTGHVNLSHSAMAQAVTSHDGPSLGWLRLLTFLLQRLRRRRSLIRDIRDDLIQSASRIKRASHYDAILRILD
jgi:hypothetical protein